MNRRKIKLSTPRMASEFVNLCSKYKCDINVYDKRMVLDAKSIMGMLGVIHGNEIEVQVMSHDQNVISSFIEDMRKFEV